MFVALSAVVVGICVWGFRRWREPTVFEPDGRAVLGAVVVVVAAAFGGAGAALLLGGGALAAGVGYGVAGSLAGGLVLLAASDRRGWLVVAVSYVVAVVLTVGQAGRVGGSWRWELLAVDAVVVAAGLVMIVMGWRGWRRE